MNRVILVALAILGVALVSVHAQTVGPDNDRGHFSFKDVPDGMLRLDNRSGQVSICAQRAAGWACQAVADDRGALESEIARLQAENSKLKQALAARGPGLPDGPRGEPRPDPNGQAQGLPSDADLDRVMTFLDKVWRRMVGMAQEMQKEQAQKEQAQKDDAQRDRDLRRDPGRKDMRWIAPETRRTLDRQS